MKCKNSTRNALVSSIVSLLLCLSMLIGTTFAWFTDSVTSANNIIKSGNLDVVMQWAEGTQAVPAEGSSDWTDASKGAIFNYDNWEPGYTQVRHIQIKNNGTLALKYKVSILANGVVSDLSDVIDVYYMDPAVQVANRTALNDSNKLNTLTNVLAKLGETGSGELLPGASDTITIAFKMQESAGNEYMNKSIGSDFSIILNATQLTHEEDSFDDQYDADAANPSYSDPVPLPENGPMTIMNDAKDFKATLPADLVKNLSDALGDNENKNRVPKLSIALTGRKNDENAKIISFVSAEIVDEYANVVDLEAMGNQIPFTVEIDAHDTFQVGDLVKIYHDGEHIATTAVDYQGNITYEALHFCEVEIYDASTVYIYSASQFIEELTKIKEITQENFDNSSEKTYRVNANFVLMNDIVVDKETEFMHTSLNGSTFHVRGVKGSINLNGHNITVKSDALLAGKAEATAVFLFQFSNVTIEGEGSISAENQAVLVYAWANCSVDIRGGNYVTNSYLRNASAIYVNYATASVNVFGGTYTGSAYAFNVDDKNANAPVIVLHEGITYADFLKGNTTDVTQKDIDADRIVLAENCELQQYEENGVALNKVVAQ